MLCTSTLQVYLDNRPDEAQLVSRPSGFPKEASTGITQCIENHPSFNNPTWAILLLVPGHGTPATHGVATLLACASFLRLSWPRIVN